LAADAEAEAEAEDEREAGSVFTTAERGAFIPRPVLRLAGDGLRLCRRMSRSAFSAFFDVCVCFFLLWWDDRRSVLLWWNLAFSSI